MLNEVAIYSTSSRSAGMYDRSIGRDGGAERQMTLLAGALAERGHRVAHITFRARDPVPVPDSLTLVHRRPRHSGSRVARGALEALAVWRALSAADAAVVVLRSASPVVGVAALFCKLRRRTLVFSSSNVSDFTLETIPSRLKTAPYRLGLRVAEVVVVQSEDQSRLVRQAFPSLRRVVHIPSFAELDPEPRMNDPLVPEAFLWFGRAVPSKQPLRYVDLAQDVPEAKFLMIPAPAGEDALLAELRAAAQDVPNLSLLEPLPHDRLQELIARSVAVVNTSTLEGMPNAFLEAWARGVPVLTLQFDPDGVVARGQLGIAADGSWDRFVAGARELWESGADREGLSGRVLRHVQEAHSRERVGARWSKLIEELRGKE